MGRASPAQSHPSRTGEARRPDAGQRWAWLVGVMLPPTFAPAKRPLRTFPARRPSLRASVWTVRRTARTVEVPTRCPEAFRQVMVAWPSGGRDAAAVGAYPAVDQDRAGADRAPGGCGRPAAGEGQGLPGQPPVTGERVGPPC
ncbi:hypothetical protein GCM10010360_25420 [Streptomyces nogalater]